MPDLTGGNLGRYEILQPISRGGMAVVYKARDSGSGRVVALKALSPQVAEQSSFLQRFRREARVVQSLRHPHIVPVEDFGEVGGYAYLVMPYLHAGTLAERLTRGPLTPMQGGLLMEQVSSALQYAHDQGVVHRDVKPSNILLDEQGNALVADFGLAQIDDASVSLTGSALLGTPAYVSPEQGRGDPVDARSDQYSLGIMLYQLTTGRLPYEAETAMAVILKQVNEAMPRPRSVDAHIPEPVERVILKATAKDPTERFESVAAMNAVFQAALAHALSPRAHPAPIIPLPPSVTPGVPSDKRKATRPWLIAAALVLLVGCPVATAAAVSLRQNPAGGVAEAAAPQLTAMQATISHLSTLIASDRASSLSASDIGTAAAATLTAMSLDATFAPLVGEATAAEPLVVWPGTGTASPTPTPTPVPKPTSPMRPTPFPTDTETPTDIPTDTPTDIPTDTPIIAPFDTPTNLLTGTPVPLHTPTPIVLSSERWKSIAHGGSPTHVCLQHTNGDVFCCSATPKQRT